MCKFNFEKAVKEIRGEETTIYEKTLKDVYNEGEDGEGHSTDDTKPSGIYALYYDEKLMKIGKAVDGFFKRMSQYYRLDKTAGSDFITDDNKNLITVQWYKLKDAEACWIDERRLQVKAYNAGEKMEWEIKK